MSLSFDDPSPSELDAFNEENTALIASRFRWGIPTGVAVALSLG